MDALELVYHHSASQWEETLPLGNGSLGAMVWGNVGREVIGLNHESLWSGYPHDKNRPQAKAALKQVRELIFNGQYQEAEELIAAQMLGEYTEAYLPLGNLVMAFEQQHVVSGYRRRLDLNQALATVDYQMGEETYHREAFVSQPHQALFIRLQGHQSFEIGLESPLAMTVTVSDHQLSYSGRCPEHVDPDYVHQDQTAVIQGGRGLAFAGSVRILQTDGEVHAYHHRLRVLGSTDTVLMVSFGEVAVPSADYATIKAAHIADYQRLFNRVKLTLGPQLARPTDERLAAVRAGDVDPGLVALYYQYGRYLLIASSRETSALPANLQGIWSWQLRAPWSSNWTVNINLQMNYWPVHSANLEECLTPYLNFLQLVAPEGQKTAAAYYGARGMVVHHNLDRWGNANPVGITHGDTRGRGNSVLWSMWPMAAPWLAHALYQAFEYTDDREYLKQVVYPLLKQVMLFLNDWLVERGDGTVTTCPSSSPENQFLTPAGQPASVTESVALDRELVRSTFFDFTRTCSELAIDDPLIAEFKAKLQRYPDVAIDDDGMLCEWDKPFAEVEPGHRHFSPVWGLFLGETFSGHPEQVAAAKKLIEHRLSHARPDQQTGWSSAWAMNLFAVLKEPEQAYAALMRLLRQSTLNNLWDSCPPFQIDGNFGATAGIANMLVQERDGQLKLLPALPDAFADGQVSGLGLKHGRSIDITWANHQLVSYTIHE